MRPLHPSDAPTGSAADGTQYLTFALGAEEYGVAILNVQEIKGYSTVTPIPNTPPYVKGVMNLRGTIVPVIDLRLRLGMPPGEYGPFTVIVVLAVGTKIVGTIVDAVSDVLTIPAADVQATPSFGSAVDLRFIAGIAHSNDKLVVLLDVDTMLRHDDLAALDDPSGLAG
jgi:purine-binding chemotaxis protein CheW